jgi:hypothetical protein
MKTVISRLRARNSRLGRILVRISTLLFLLPSAIGGSLEYLKFIPEHWFPSWVKVTIVVCGVLGAAIGQMTQDPKYTKP